MAGKLLAKEKKVLFSWPKHYSIAKMMKNDDLCSSTGKAIPTNNAKRRLNNISSITDVRGKWEHKEK